MTPDHQFLYEQEDNLRFNLFRFAPKELSHSAFWAWVLQSTVSTEPALQLPRELGRAFLAKVGMPLPTRELHVHTEVKLSSRNRIDIRVDVDDKAVLFIENKVKALPDDVQLKRYEESAKLSDKRHSLVIISTAFDDAVLSKLKGLKHWQYWGVDELRDLLKAYSSGHPLIEDYAAWLNNEALKREELRKAAQSADHKLRQRALGHIEGQWALMQFLTKGFAGYQYYGINQGGRPWTQFCFVENDGDQDALFYRIDRSSRGYYFALRQYNSAENLDAKRARLEKLRAYWKTAWQSCDTNISFTHPRSRGAMESEVALVLLDNLDPQELRSALQDVHKHLLHQLETNGWTVSKHTPQAD